MGRRGNCWENKRSAVSRPQGEGAARHNACSETLFGSLKVERLHGQRFVTRRQAKDEVIDWVLSGTTAPGYIRRWLTSARCALRKTGSRLRPSKPIRDSAIGYGF